MSGDREDPLIPGGPTDTELRDASVSQMLAPLRAQVDAITASALEEIESGLAIVRAIAAAPDTADACQCDQCDGSESHACLFCGVMPVGIDRSEDAMSEDTSWTPPPVEAHQPSCPWRLAREWVAEHPEAT